MCTIVRAIVPGKSAQRCESAFREESGAREAPPHSLGRSEPRVRRAAVRSGAMEGADADAAAAANLVAAGAGGGWDAGEDGGAPVAEAVSPVAAVGDAGDAEAAGGTKRGRKPRSGALANTCQVPNCGTPDLEGLKRFMRRYRICEACMKAQEVRPSRRCRSGGHAQSPAARPHARACHAARFRPGAAPTRHGGAAAPLAARRGAPRGRTRRGRRAGLQRLRRLVASFSARRHIRARRTAALTHPARARAPQLLVEGEPQRFCQQCGRYVVRPAAQCARRRRAIPPNLPTC